MGVSYECTDTFVFKNPEDASRFAKVHKEKQRSTMEGAHFDVDVPIYVEHQSNHVVTLSSGGYGIFNLEEFRDQGAYGVVRTIYSCQGQEVYMVIWLLEEDFTYENSTPFDEDDPYDDARFDPDSFYPTPGIVEEKEGETDAEHDRRSEWHHDGIVNKMKAKDQEHVENLIGYALQGG